MKIVILYSELAGYTVNCMQTAKRLYPDVELFVFRWPINKEAPFQFDFTGMNVFEKDNYKGDSLLNKVKDINPDCIMVSGWMDKDYVNVAKIYRLKIPVVLTIDNHWRGDLKQMIASALSKFLVRNKFNTVWVPGEIQAKFARKLGFSENKIFKGFYAADTTLFSDYFNRSIDSKKDKFPKRFLYVGRYVEHKGIFDIWNAFIELQDENPNDWELWSVGTGDQWSNRLEHPKIKHLGFVQPTDFQEIVGETSVYVLPSHYEPWGVSLQEFTAAGYPVLVSDKVGSSEAFCEAGKNGYVFKSGDKEMIKGMMSKIMIMSQNDFNDMSEHSRKLSLQITPEKWANTLMEIANG